MAHASDAIGDKFCRKRWSMDGQTFGAGFEIGYMYVVVATAISKTFQKSGTDRFAASSLASPTHRGQRGTFG
jgi:hypothetical protein